MTNWLIKLLCIAAALYVLAALLLYVFQRNLLYHPTPLVPLPENAEQLSLPIDEGNVTLLRLNPGRDKALLYLGGNAEQVANTAPLLAAQLPDHSIYLLNYRGYNNSDGNASEQSLYRDATRSYQLIAEQHDQISVMGRSLGTGIATYLASTQKLERMVLVTPYDSIAAVAQKHYPIFPKLLIKDRYDSVGRAGKINIPTLVLIAGQDNVIPPQHAHKLVEAMPDNLVQQVTLANSGHNSFGSAPEYWHYVVSFLRGNKADEHEL